MYTGMILIKETGEEDLTNILALWNNGDVMKYVGFPNGLEYSYEKILNWYKRNKESKFFDHYSIYTEEYGYCGETGYQIDNNGNKNTGLDIKLKPEVQGKGIAEYALRHIIEYLCREGKTISVWVDPNEDNNKARKLYKKIGFMEKDFPEYLLEEDDGKHIYMELILNEYRRNS
jgi:RimJ/RimL family protein N-acetyltransferase